MDEIQPLVSISCITYNHAPYIRQCLDGFVMQKTNFAFEVLIHDDCSTDGTTEIIKEYEAKYPNIIKPLYETENQYQQGKPFGSGVWNFPRARGKYIAMCEGDDYWIDPLKLQKQVDFLDNNPNYGLVFTLAKEFVQSKGIFLDKPFGRKVDNTSDLINSNTIHTPTVLFRHDAYLMYAQEIGFNRGWAVGDYPIWIYISTKYKIHLIEEATTVYRILENSASHSTNIDKTEKYLNSVCDMLQFFIEKYSLGQIEKMQERRNRVLFDNAFRYRDKKRADIYFNRICNKSLKLYIKYFILKSKFFNT